MFKKITFIILVTAFSNIAVAEKTYTKEELQQMSKIGNYPEQGKVKNTQTSDASFLGCKSSAKEMASQLSSLYPTQEIMDSSIAYSLKIWTNDGVVLVTCSEPDHKMIMTTSGYR
jgi:hypothetical protein